MSNIVNIDKTPFVQDKGSIGEEDNVSTKIVIAHDLDRDFALVFEQTTYEGGKEVSFQEVIIPSENLMGVLPDFIMAAEEVLRLTKEANE